MNDVGDLFNELYYIYKEIQWRKNGLETIDIKKFDHKKLRFTDDYQYESEEEKEEQTRRKSNKKNHLKNDKNWFEWVKLINGLIKNKQA